MFGFKSMLVIVLLVFMLLGVVPGFAQEATAEPPVEPPVVVVEVPDTGNSQTMVVFTVALVVLGVISFVALRIMGNTTRPAVVELGVSAPEWALTGIKSAYDSAIRALERMVEQTPTGLDNAALEEIRGDLGSLWEEIERLRAGGGAPPTLKP